MPGRRRNQVDGHKNGTEWSGGQLQRLLQATLRQGVFFGSVGLGGHQPVVVGGVVLVELGESCKRCVEPLRIGDGPRGVPVFQREPCVSSLTLSFTLSFFSLS